MDAAREKKLTAAKNEMTHQMRRISDELGMSAEEVLALCAFMTGGAIAMQDQRKMTPAQAMDIVQRNIEAGNRTTLEILLSAGGRAQ